MGLGALGYADQLIDCAIARLCYNVFTMNTNINPKALKTKTETFSVRLPSEMREYIAQMAEAQNRSQSYIIKEAVSAYIENQEAYYAAIEEARKDVEAGRVVSGEEVFAWLKELKTNPHSPRPIAG